MSVKQVPVNVSEQAYALGGNLVQLVSAVMAAVKSGVNLGNLSVLVGAVLADLIPIVSEVSALPAEEKENTQAFVTALGLQVEELVKVLVAK